MRYRTADAIVAGQPVLSRDRKLTGAIATGNALECHLEGCRGNRFAVNWPNGKRTFCCTDGMVEDGKGWRIA